MQTATVTAQVIPPATVTEPVSSPAAPRRVEWLDGIRGAAALFVVLHHTWLSVWPAFPRNIGPWWVGWLLYGHLAVAVFIVVSGFSLSLAPIRRGDTLSGGAGRFLRRRAWRIIPPYWAALIISTLISWLVLQPSLAA
ncbi:MAG: acyltransferase family protein, partial [Solirubrobacteraceae bacterium]